MPPRDSANLVAVADEEPRDALTVLPLALPLPLSQRIWVSLPCDVRLRCREVARGWRDALAEPRLWTELDLTATSGVVARVTAALLQAAAARAGGQLERLSVAFDWKLRDALLPVFATNAVTLRLLRLESDNGRRFFTTGLLNPLLRAAPQQCVVEADVASGYAEELGKMLRNEPPFQAVRLQAFCISCPTMHATDIPALAAELAAHPSLRALMLSAPLHTFAALDAIVDVALSLPLRKLTLFRCGMLPASAVALARLLRAGDALRELSLSHTEQLLDAHVAALLADALRSNRTLTSLTLANIGLWHDADAAAALFGALVGHTSLTSISLSQNCAAGDAAAGAGTLLGALVAADAPLRVLDVSYSMLGDASMGPLVDALPQNTRLRELSCSIDDMSASLRAGLLMPALAANTSLQQLRTDHDEADAYIAARTAAAARS